MADAPVVPPVGPLDPSVNDRLTKLESFSTALHSFFDSTRASIGELLGAPGSGGTTVPGGKTLEHCKPVRGWVNSTGAPKDRTTEVTPIGGSFGGDVTIYTAPLPGKVANPPQPPAPPPAGNPLPDDGGSIGLSVPNGHAVWIHLNSPNNKTARVIITQSA